MPIRDRLCSYGACLVTPTKECLEALRLPKGGINLDGGWVDYHMALGCVRRDDIPILSMRATRFTSKLCRSCGIILPSGVSTQIDRKLAISSRRCLVLSH